MLGPSARYTAIAQRIFTNWFKDSCEILPETDVRDAYGTIAQKWASTNPPTIYRGHLREVERIPGINQEAGAVFTTGNFIIHLQADAVISGKCAVRVNGGDLYVVENPYTDKANRFSNQYYCYRVK